MSEAPTWRLPPAVRAVLAVALAAYGAAAAWLVWRTSILEPYSDMFDWLARWRRFQADGDLGRYLWFPHNFHHLVWTFTILDLDIAAFGGSGYLFLGVGVACLAVTAAMLAQVAAAAAGRGLRLVGVGGALALSLMGCDVLDATADINTTYVHALVFAVAAMVLAEAPGGRPRLRLSGALACAVAAGLGSAAGLAVWPALLFTAWRQGRRGWMAAVVACGAVFGLAYMLGQGPAGPVAGGGAAHGAAAGLLFLNYLGLPWVRGFPPAGWLIGLAVLAFSLAALIWRGRPGANWPERAAVSLILFSLVTAGMAAVGRTGATAPDQVPMRYAVFLIPLHVGLWILVLPRLRRAWAQRPGTMAGAAVAAAAVMLAHQALMSVFAVRTADINLRMVADFHAGQRTSPMLTTIYADLGAAEALSEQLRRDDLYQRELRPVPAPKP